MINADFARDTWRKLFFISGRLRTTSYGILGKDYECSFAQFPIIQFFFTYPNATPAVKDLTSYIGFPSGAVSQAVEGLVRNSVLVRIPSEKDRRSTLIRATDELRAVRDGAINHFQKMLDAFKAGGYATPEEIALADEIFVRLAESRTGGEISVVKTPADLAVPGLVKHSFIDPEQLKALPPWIMTMHFVTVLKGPTLVYYYGTRGGRMTLGKLRLLDHLFLLSESGESPMVKDLAARFRISAGVTSQTLNAMIQDGVVERISSPDRRTIRIRLTQEGLRLRRQTSAVYTRFMQNFLSSVETDQAESFSRILDKFLVFLENDGKRFLLS